MLYILLFYYLFSCGFTGYVVKDYCYSTQIKTNTLLLIIIVAILSPISFPILLGAYCFTLCDKNCKDE